MKPHALALLGLMLFAPFAATAQSDPPESDLHGLEDVLPDEAREAVEQFLEMVKPMISQFGALISDLPEYEPPEVLPNGDIIIRRKRPDPAVDPDVPAQQDT